MRFERFDRPIGMDFKRKHSFNVFVDVDAVDNRQLARFFDDYDLVCVLPFIDPDRARFDRIGEPIGGINFIADCDSVLMRPDTGFQSTKLYLGFVVRYFLGGFDRIRTSDAD